MRKSFTLHENNTGRGNERADSILLAIKQIHVTVILHKKHYKINSSKISPR